MSALGALTVFQEHPGNGRRYSSGPGPGTGGPEFRSTSRAGPGPRNAARWQAQSEPGLRKVGPCSALGALGQTSLYYKKQRNTGEWPLSLREPVWPGAIVHILHDSRDAIVV